MLSQTKLSVFVLIVAAVSGTTVAAPADNALDKKELDKAWADLAAVDTAQALRSLLMLSRAPKDSVPFVVERMKMLLSGEAPPRIAQLIEDLDSAKFPVRDKASKELELVVDEAAPHLQKVLNGKPSLELRRRVELLLSRRKAADALGARHAQIIRSLALIELAADAPARKFLTALASDGREDWLAKEAEAALKRLAEEKTAPSWDDLTGTDVGATARAFLLLHRTGGEGIAELGQVESVLQLANQVPPLLLRSRGITTRQLPHELLPYRKELLDMYKTDEKETPLRTAVKDALQVLSRSEAKDLEVKEEQVYVGKEVLAELKRDLETIQRDKIGNAIFQLGRAAEELEELKKDRDREGKLWQANYDYVLARLYARQACILEYSVMLGRIRREDMPALDLERHTGWRLTAKGMMSDRDAQELADKARGLLKKLSGEHKGTPWEVIGRQESNSPFGLTWVPLAK